MKIFLIFLIFLFLVFASRQRWGRKICQVVWQSLSRQWRARILILWRKVRRRIKKQEIWARIGMLVLALALLSIFQWITILLAGSWIFRGVISLVIAWLVLEAIKQRSKRYSLTFALAGVLSILGTIYLPEFKESFSSAVNWMAGVALLVFVAEELGHKNWYPGAVGVPVLVLVVVMLVGAVYLAVQPHSYYRDEGPRSFISVAQKQQEVKDQAILQSRAWKKSVPGLKKGIDPSLSGVPSTTPQVIFEWLQLTTKNHLPTEYGRLEAVAGKLLFVVYLLVAYAVFMLIALPEMLGEAISKHRAKKTSKKGVVKEGLSTTSYVILELFGRVADSFVKRRRLL